jgi:hypothetical protein
VAHPGGVAFAALLPQLVAIEPGFPAISPQLAPIPPALASIMPKLPLVLSDLRVARLPLLSQGRCRGKREQEQQSHYVAHVHKDILG